MSWFSRIEETCAAFIERAFANMFPSDLEPTQIARKLVATMEARTEHDDGAMRAPDRYSVCVHALDFQRLSPHRTYLEAEWTALLADIAARVGIVFANGCPVVELRERAGTIAGAVDIEVGGASDVPELRRLFLIRTLTPGAAGVSHRVSGATRVGRAPESDIVLSDPSVSRHHALLDVRSGTLIVRDAGSTNGTFVNGERISMQTVSPGERLAFGKTEMSVEREP